MRGGALDAVQPAVWVTLELDCRFAIWSLRRLIVTDAETRRQMTEIEPDTLLSSFSNKDAVATEWAHARRVLGGAEVYWLSTVRPDGSPHVTPLLGVWLHSALHFCTGPNERKAKNLAENSHCVLTTGCNTLEGLDLVVEGQAVKVTDRSALRAIADAFESKYGPHFKAPDGTWAGLGDAIRDGEVLVFHVDPTIAFGFGKGTPYSQTRWGFA
jgi:nitroimidazol reductase NimA-like FMN-containing flavoprotein (pyridoxamine 5'-phosphate oxidase superfamily)